MSRHFDWDKSRRQRIVWERGGIPVWHDGWGPNSHSKSATTRAKRELIPLKLGPKTAGKSKISTPADYTLTISGDNFEIRYIFESISEQELEKIGAEYLRLMERNSKSAWPRFDAFLVQQFSFHDSEFQTNATINTFVRKHKKRTKPKLSQLGKMQLNLFLKQAKEAEV